MMSVVVVTGLIPYLAVFALINITPIAPPGVSSALQTIIGWVYYLALAIFGILGVYFFYQFAFVGDASAKPKFILFVIMFLLTLFLPTLLHTLAPNIY